MGLRQLPERHRETGGKASLCRWTTRQRALAKAKGNENRDTDWRVVDGQRKNAPVLLPSLPRSSWPTIGRRLYAILHQETSQPAAASQITTGGGGCWGLFCGAAHFDTHRRARKRENMYGHGSRLLHARSNDDMQFRNLHPTIAGRPDRRVE